MADLPNECFVIMPISDCDGYSSGHFEKVYQDIIEPSIKSAGYNPVLASNVKQTNIIHVDILRRLVHSPLAVCDLSSRNPNVLFELGFRQAFDMPVVLLQDERTPRIFDVSSIRTIPYSSALAYRDVIKTQSDIKISIEATVNAGPADVNSLVRLLSIEKAKTPDLTLEGNQVLQLILDKIEGLERRVFQTEDLLNSRAFNEMVDSMKNARIAFLKKDQKLLSISLKAAKAQMDELRSSLSPEFIRKFDRDYEKFCKGLTE